MNLLERIPEYILNILNILEYNNYNSYLVGGCVRDLLLNRQPKDYDITTSALPEQVKSIFSHVVSTGEKHGTVTVVTNEGNVEITTMRKDGIYKDNRRPSIVEFTNNITQDLSRRDFTINAMAIDINGNIIDPFNGINDINNKIIKTVGNPNQRYLEDGLRLMRCIRFACVLNFNIEKETEWAIIRNKNLIKNISVERIKDELCKILISNNPSFGIRKLYEVGLLQYIIPELCDCVNFDQQNPYHHKDVFEHTMLVLDGVSNDIIIRLAALLHDIAKPKTFQLKKVNNKNKLEQINSILLYKGTFHYHHIVGMNMAKEILRRLKFDNKTINTVCVLVKEHMSRYDFLKTLNIKKFINRVGVENLDYLFELQIADIKACRPPHDVSKVLKLKEEVKRVIEEKQPLTVKDLNINGYDLMNLGMKPGKEMGLLLKDMLRLVLENPKLNNKEFLIGYAKEKFGLNINKKKRIRRMERNCTK